jgi:VanZ family protein
MKRLKKAYIFWIPLIVATTLATTNAASPYNRIVLNDKIFHAFTFLYLTLSWYWIDRSHVSLYRIVGILFFYGLLIEWLQFFIPSRTCSLADAAANGAGILIGLMLIRLLQYANQRRIRVPTTSHNQQQDINVSDEPHTITT